VDGRQEPPVGLQEHASRSGQILGDQRVQQAGGDSALHDDAAEPAATGEVLVVVQRVAVTSHLGEQLDVAGRHGARPAGGGADLHALGDQGRGVHVFRVHSVLLRIGSRVAGASASQFPVAFQK